MIVVSPQNRALVVPRNGQTSTLFPGALELDDKRLVVPHGLREFMLLQRIGFKLDNPMLRYYDWCGGKPFDVQKQTCSMLTANPRAYVLNHMGTGKTKAALWAWDYLRGNGYAEKLLVVAPLSTLNFVWARECFATLPHRKCTVLHHVSREKRLALLRESDAEIFVINHDGLRTIEAELQARTDIDTLVLDELAVYRNNSDRSKRMRAFAERFAWVWGLTGAPMPNAPTDVWAQCRIVTPHTVPRYRRHAEDALMTRVSQFKLVPKPDAIDRAFGWMQPAVRFNLDDVVELPDIVSRTIDVDLTSKQQLIYEKMVRECQVMIAEKTITAVNAGAAMNKLLQISCGWVYTSAPECVEIDSKPRQDLLLELIQQSERKVLVFVPFRHALAGLATLLSKNSVEHAVVHGDVSDRDTIFNLFQNTDKYKVLLAHPQCLSHGLTLTAADTIIWYAPIASLETYDQANARIRRVGQKHKQQILHLQSTPVEKKLYALLRTKQKIQDKLLSMFEHATENGR